ncbi:uncharacterized protein LOC135146146 [Zophobas morio]|uniref:uncharacterized protein LOC135146146 n=1 Tax=Zophobas morio TaxID=2755281 RepID=UPI003082FE67
MHSRCHGKFLTESNREDCSTRIIIAPQTNTWFLVRDLLLAAVRPEELEEIRDVCEFSIAANKKDLLLEHSWGSFWSFSKNRAASTLQEGSVEGFPPELDFAVDGKAFQGRALRIDVQCKNLLFFL